MAETWFTYPKMVRKDGRTEFVRTPPGLLLSLGDGTAVEVTAEMLDAAVRRIPARPAKGRALRDDLTDALAALIQQAQEARGEESDAQLA